MNIELAYLQIGVLDESATMELIFYMILCRIEV